ncbi:MAG: hypothetical protein A2571_01370 [Candidatus Vogelbacteria bacterium RIFOXYD1_FULL_44_32]|uniref:Glycosyltransferase subfamily 4-like N-terminal domain-containing protein n=1 Tax=Candidatus Vogelbacteria bacterium RIFOXYD1_FULL_44_32 TaxID=1802438 RepID=A0A1G2QEJ3_9BACT|nr:MAG: hypothetical protein A2571_01370 [Candidatus Vogelbacteria bacterium RIFOXYD1_FULL_44_32]
MKKILFITSASLADLKRGTPIRIFNFVEQLKKDHQVLLYESVPTNQLLKQLWRFLVIVKNEKPDLVMTATDVDISLPFWLKIITGVKIAIDLHGLAAAEMYFHGQMGQIKSWLFQRKISWQIRWYDLVFVVSPKLIDYYGHRLKQGVVVYGGVTTNEFYHGAIRPPAVFTIGYTGNCNPYQGVNTVLNVASRIRQKNLFSFRLNLILSNGRGEIEDQLKVLGLSDVTELHFKVPHEEVPALIAASDVLVIARPSVPMTEYAYPSKLPEYLATGIPVVTTRVGPVEALFQDQNCLIIISPDQVEVELEQALVKLQVMTRAEREILGSRAVAFVRQNLTWDVLGATINKNVEAL